ncbi:ABC transporter ATP-binding protein [Cupriavidus basilensis]|uniref:Branched-chain amino acid transport ATP-binding protein LivF n=1 Tax=Cupriavidus basilensis TaxID=68895 RepID=A0A0C4YEV4_9BURK|nr:ABC transporter ATP-binding protein [Cupriavidus basilensis]AJG24267.1 Branched-chain amino acid transport ATP-binding protein LivF [Cupriavidus basilensis]
MLSVHELDAYYGDFQALFALSLTIRQGESVAIIGANGAGKSTLLKAISGALPVRHGAIRLREHSLGRDSAAQVVRKGIALVPEGRRMFPSLSVEENLQIGAYARRPGPWNLGRVYTMFPRLAERRRQNVTSLSGGEQQMVAIGRALMSNPSMLMCDELSLGLAPKIIREMYGHLATLKEEGTTLLIVEQDIHQALRFSDRYYCMQKGRVTLSGKSASASKEEIGRAYFGEEQ